MKKISVAALTLTLLLFAIHTSAFAEDRTGPSVADTKKFIIMLLESTPPYIKHTREHNNYRRVEITKARWEGSTLLVESYTERKKGEIRAYERERIPFNQMDSYCSPYDIEVTWSCASGDCRSKCYDQDSYYGPYDGNPGRWDRDVTNRCSKGSFARFFMESAEHAKKLCRAYSHLVHLIAKDEVTMDLF